MFSSKFRLYQSNYMDTEYRPQVHTVKTQDKNVLKGLQFRLGRKKEQLTALYIKVPAQWQTNHYLMIFSIIL